MPYYWSGRPLTFFLSLAFKTNIQISDFSAKVRELQPLIQESRAVARKPRDAAAVLFSLKFPDNIHYKFKSSQASKARLQSSKHSGAK